MRPPPRLGALLLGRLLGPAQAALPTSPPRAVAFSDTDPRRNFLGGIVAFTAATDEWDITYYALYFGSSSTVRLAPLANLLAGGVTTVDLGTGFPLPTGATYLMVYSANSAGVNFNMASTTPLVDRAVPGQSPVALAFSDQDYDYRQMGGKITITRATVESDVTYYGLYFGLNPTTLLQLVPAGLLPVATSPLVLTVPNDTMIPVGASYLLAYTGNADGLCITPASTALVDRAIPNNTATSVDFVDYDLDRGQVSGIVTIGRATNEALITYYAIYFARGASGPTDRLVALLPKTGNNLTYFILPDTILPVNSTYLLVKTRSGDGEMATGIGTAIVDRAVPLRQAANVTFTDIDIDRYEVGGNITIWKASDESDLTYYYICFADIYLVDVGAIGSVSKGPSQLVFQMPLNTPIPSGAVYIMVLAGNTDGVATITYARTVIIIDTAVPLNAPYSVQFVDQDQNAGAIGGTVTVQRAADESDVTGYACYYAKDGTGSQSSKQSTTPIGTANVSGLTKSYATFTIGFSSPVPYLATYIAAFSFNGDGEGRVGVVAPLVDRTSNFPTQAVSSVQFTDFDLNIGTIGGPITWFEPTNIAGLTQYSIYMAVDAVGTLRRLVRAAAIGTTSYNLPMGTALSGGSGIMYSYILIYTANSYGEALTVATRAIVDRALPVAQVANLSFVDQDARRKYIIGPINWTLPANPALPTAFTNLTAYLASDSSGANRSLLATLLSTARTVTIPAGTFVANYTFILVYTVNAVGEALWPAMIPLVDLYKPEVAVQALRFFDEDLGTGELGGDVSWTEPNDTTAISTYRIYLQDPNNSRVLIGEVPRGSVVFAMPFNTLLRNYTILVVIGSNSVGEGLVYANITISDRQVDSCPKDFGHNFTSTRWRVVAGTVNVTWRIQALRFFNDPYCSDLAPTVPLGWPRLPRLASGTPFSSPPSPVNLYEIFLREDNKTSSWDASGVQLPPKARPFWSTGGPCLNATRGSTFQPDYSGCSVGFDWRSDVLTQGGRVVGSAGSALNIGIKVHCVEVDQSAATGEFADNIALQWYDDARRTFRTLMQKSVSSGGLVRIAYQKVLAAECNR